MSAIFIRMRVQRCDAESHRKQSGVCLHCICEGLRHVSEMAGDGSMDQNDLVGHCKFSDRLLRVLEKRK